MSANLLQNLEKDLGHQFADRGILQEALRHSSRAGIKKSYERLEFLGDRVLGLLLAHYFFETFPDEDEGALSLRLHAEARMSALAVVARKLRLDDYIQSQAGLDVAANDSLMADVVESIMAAIYIDAGLNAAKDFLERHWCLNSNLFKHQGKDAKSRLQEWSLQRGLGLPVYQLLFKSGPDHAPQMIYEVKIEGFNAFKATAGSRKIAEQNAAEAMLEHLQERKFSS